MLDGRIGLEVTTYHQPPVPGALPRKQVEKAWDEVRGDLMAASAGHREIAGVGAKFFFKALNVPPRGRDRRAFVRETFEFVIHVRECLRKDRIRFRVDGERYPVLAQYVESVTLRALDPPLKWLSWWNHNVGHGVVELSLLDSLQSKLDSGRPSGFEESWLLVATGLRISERAELGLYPAENLQTFSTLNAALASGPFDRVCVLEVPTTPPSDRPLLVWKRGTGLWQAIEAP